MSKVGVLNILHKYKDSWVSLESLAAYTNLTKEKLRQELKQLEQAGYNLDFHPDYGYRLRGVPDRLIPDEIQRGLEASIIGRDILTYDEVDSTMDVAKTIAERGAREGTCIFAEFQRKGRGRAGRQWLCPKYKGILMTTILKPKIPYEKICFLSGMVAVAVTQTIKNVLRLEATIKWPNDILVNEKKVCGILVEMETVKGKEAHFLAGIGLNVNIPSEELPKDVVYPSTSLLIELGHQADRISLARALLRNLDDLYVHLKHSNYEYIRKRWVQLSPIIGHRAIVEEGGSEYTGKITDLTTNGGIAMELDSGTKRVFRWEHLTIKAVLD